MGLVASGVLAVIALLCLFGALLHGAFWLDDHRYVFRKIIANYKEYKRAKAQATMEATDTELDSQAPESA
jgi:hypothetical protein